MNQFPTDWYELHVVTGPLRLCPAPCDDVVIVVLIE